MDETVNGVKSKGPIEEVARDSDIIADAVEQSSGNSQDDFQSWSPDKDDDKEDIKERTVDHASSDDIQLVERLESFIYGSIITPFNKLYFDSDDVSASIEEQESGYEMRVAVRGEADADEVKDKCL